MLPPFELSLDEYAELWKPVPYGKEVRLGGTLPQELTSHAVEMNVDFTQPRAWWITANDLRRRSEENEPEKSRLYMAWMLFWDAQEVSTYADRQYTLDLMSGGARTQDDSRAVRNLLRTALESRGYSSIVVACLMESARICLEHQMPMEARHICAACFVQQGYDAPSLEVRDFYRELVGRTESLSINNSRSFSFNPMNPQEERFVRCLLSDLGANDAVPKVLAASQTIIPLSPREAIIGQEVTSHLGGLPDVEENWEWPERMEFLAQINLAELVPYDINSVLPQHGILRFFMENLAYGCEGDWFRVEFFEGDLTTLCQAKAPNFLTDLREPHDYVGEDVVYKEVIVGGGAGSQVHLEESGWTNRDSFYETSEVVRYASLALEADRQHRESHQVLGVVAREAFTPNSDEENYWVLLLAIDSCDDAEMMFSDAGTMYFYIRREDLLARRFDRVEVSMTNG